MYKVKWDSKINGILLDNKINDKEEIVPPRPVFYEELDFLGFNKYWGYPKEKEPLLWAIGRQYYYKGVCVAEARGGNIYESPELIVEHKLALEPIDVKLLIEKNEDSLFIVENEAMDFVEYTQKKYKDKVDYFAVAFSGGKDSQVVLDIVSRVLAPDDYMVIFTDTTMEIPFTYETVKETKEIYQKIYPELKFYTAMPPGDALEFWEQFGPPSRIHRWCCSVCKTAPFARLVRKIHNENGYGGQPKISVFEGIRSEESNTRSRYSRKAKGVKHFNITNNRVIMGWNISEVYLYLLYRNITLNKGYRIGLQRIGCSICPFASEWSENILGSIFPKLTEKYVTKIETTLGYLGIKDSNKIKNYISKGQWKKRAGGKSVNTGKTTLDFVKNNGNLKVILNEPKEKFGEWLKTVGEVFNKQKDGKITGEIKIGKEHLDYEVKSTEDNRKFITLYNIGRDVIAKGRLKKIMYKTTYCIHCGACEAECPTGALTVMPEVKVNRILCVHCANCLNFVDKGCLMAKSIHESTGGKSMRRRSSGIDRYSTFGMRKEWLEGFLNNPKTWLEKNRLGPRQKLAMKWWLKESNLLNPETNEPTRFAGILNMIKSDKYSLIWELTWVNLSYGSLIVKWYVNNVKFGHYVKKELIEILMNDFPGYSEGTLTNPINALINMFDRSPLGQEMKLGVLEKKGTAVKLIGKIGINDIHSVAVAYSLYKLAEDKKRYDFTVSDFYEDSCEGGPYKLFGISREKLEDILRYLQEEKNQTVRVDLAADLDNVFLREDITSMDILKILPA